MMLIMVVAVCFLYTVTCWYALRREDMRQDAMRRHPSGRGDDQTLF